MPCPKCLARPGYHNFVNFGSLNGAALFYSAPAKTEDMNQDGTKLANLMIHIEEIGSAPWIWVIDCGNMGLKHYTDMNFNTRLLDIIAKNKNLTGVWIVRPNIWIRGAHKLFNTMSSAIILKKVSYFDGSKLELLDKFQSVGMGIEAIQWLIRQ